jgi:hypothetical protein
MAHWIESTDQWKTARVAKLGLRGTAQWRGAHLAVTTDHGTYHFEAREWIDARTVRATLTAVEPQKGKDL